MFETRADRLTRLERQNDSLTGRLAELGLLVADYQAQAAETLEPEAKPYAELCDDLECAEDKRRRLYDVRAEFASPAVCYRFADKGAGKVYDYLLEILQIKICQCERDIADINSQIMQIITANSGADLQENLLLVEEYMELKPVSDWKCVRYIDQILNGPV